MSKCWYCNEELTTANYCDEHIGICTKCYNSMFKFGNEFVKGLTDKIADLEAKLAESEKKFVVANNLRKSSDEVLLNYKTEKYGLDKTIQELRKMKLNLPEKEWYYKGFENCERQMSSHIADLTLEVKQLKQQLAEKEKEIERMKQILVDREETIVFADKTIKGLNLNHNQDKISFCIEQLEKVRKTIKTLHGQKNCKIGNSYIQKKDKLYNKYIIELDILEEVLGIFDNQIEELKKEMK